MRYSINAKNREYRDKRALEDYNRGMKITNVIKKHKMSWQYLLRLFNANNISYNPRRRGQRENAGIIRKKKVINEFEKQIAEEYEKGYTIRKLANKYTIANSDIANILRKMSKKIREEDKKEIANHKALCSYCDVNIWRACLIRNPDISECKNFKLDHRYNRLFCKEK